MVVMWEKGEEAGLDLSGGSVTLLADGTPQDIGYNN
jgi:hypothetical protein